MTKFNVFSGVLKAFESEDGKKRIKTVASSTLTDRQGDKMTMKALEAMSASAVGMTIFLNHSYKVPEDVFGIVEKADITQRGDEFDLDFDIEVDEDNPRALATHKSVMRGVKLGTSIGAQVKEAYKDRETGAVIIDDVALLEASIVGIPANPRSFVQYAVKALDENEEEAEEEEIVKETTPAESVDADTQSETTSGDLESQPDTVEEPEAAQEGDTPTPEDAPDGITKDAEPEETAEVKEPMPVSELDSDVVGDEAKALLAMKQADFTTLLRMVETTTGELVETKKELWAAQKQVRDLERERDAANANVDLAKQFVAKLGELPIGRRASHSAVISDFNEKFSGIYDPDVIKMLTSGDTNE